MKHNNFKWWYALFGFLGYGLAMLVMTLLMTQTQSINTEVINLGALLNVTMFLLAGVFCLALLRFFSGGKVSREEFGLSTKRLLKPLAIGGALGLLFFALSEFIELNNEALRQAGEQVKNTFAIGKNPVNDLLLLLNICLFAPVAEEIIFRGVVFKSIFEALKKYPKLPKWLPLIVAVLASAWAFVSIHGGGGQDAQLFLLGVLGAFAALAFYLTNRLHSAVLVHAVNNTAVFMTMLFSATSISFGYGVLLAGMALTCLALCVLLAIAFGRILPSVAQTR